jgi:SAM-dependent methyltransferase
MAIRRDEGYEEAFLQYGESPESLQWGNYRSMALRFRQLVAGLDINGRRILDVGCGMGDLLPYLYAKSSDFNYLGVDIVSEFIEIAKKRYKGHDFKLADPFTEKLHQKFDLIFLSGVLNIKVPNYQEERKERIKKLFGLAGEAFAFNMAGTWKQLPDAYPVSYMRTQEVLDFCLTLTPKVILRSHYLPRDFTIVMYK